MGFELDIEPADFAFEEDLKLNPYDLKKWLRYVQSKSHKDHKYRYTIYERALIHRPRSYKLWYNYLMERITECKDLCIIDRRVVETNNAFERSLMFMHKMPRIWMMYCEFLTWQRFTTRTRKAFDRALMSLPLTQHDRIWPLYIRFIKAIKVPETSIRVFRRYVQLYPDNMEDYVDFMERHGQWDEAVKKLAWIVNQENFASKKRKTKVQLWKRLCNLMCRHAADIKSVNVDAIIRSGIRRYPQEVGYLWNLLAEYYTRCSLFEKAYDVFGEAINTVATVRDFTIVYDAYVEFQNNIVQVKMQQLQADDQDFDEDDDDELFDISSPVDLDMMMDRIEYLNQRRDILVSSVKLRQNPHNVREWLLRVKIYVKREDFNEAADVFATAVNTVDPYQSTGRYSTLWVAFAKFYEEHDDEENGLSNARDIFKMAVNKDYKGVDDLATVWCEWAEMELRHKNYEQALEVLRKAATFPRPEQRSSDKVQDRLWKSTKLWSFRADLEESMSELDDIKACYNDMIKLKVATVHNILNFAERLWKHQAFEEAFKAYERGVHIFQHPHVMVIWMTYINRFLKRYDDSRIERARELFDQAISACPPGPNRKLYLMYARLEEQRGLARHALRIYDEAVAKVKENDRPQMYRIYIKKAADLFGVTRTREIYEKAIQNLPDDCLADFCVRYFKLECQLGEIDRARAVLMYGCQFADPMRYDMFWEEWNTFEIEHGNEETFREMLRMKRSVESQTTTSSIINGFVSAGIQLGEKRTASDANLDAPKDAIDEIAAEEADQGEDGEGLAQKGKDEVILDAAPEISTKAVPKAVFSGALERFKKAKATSNDGMEE